MIGVLSEGIRQPRITMTRCRYLGPSLPNLPRV